MPIEEDIKNRLQRNDTSLKQLDLTWRGELIVEDFRVLGEYLSRNIIVESLDLGACNIDSDRLTAFFSSYKDNHVLKKLLLGGNQINDVGAKILAENLKNNKTLQYLFLRSNQVGDEGVKALAEKCQYLIALDVGNNWTTSEGADALIKAINNKDSRLSSVNFTPNYKMEHFLQTQANERGILKVLEREFIINNDNNLPSNPLIQCMFDQKKQIEDLRFQVEELADRLKEIELERDRERAQQQAVNSIRPLLVGSDKRSNMRFQFNFNETNVNVEANGSLDSKTS